MPFPITVAEIAKTEAKTGFTFPLGLKTRFSKNNGGEVEVGGDCWQLIPFIDVSDRKRLARTCNDIVRETTRMRDWRGFPPDAFVVAQNGGGAGGAPGCYSGITGLAWLLLSFGKMTAHEPKGCCNYQRVAWFIAQCGNDGGPLA